MLCTRRVAGAKLKQKEPRAAEEVCHVWGVSTLEHVMCGTCEIIPLFFQQNKSWQVRRDNFSTVKKQRDNLWCAGR